jgi:hypothetical protein
MSFQCVRGAPSRSGRSSEELSPIPPYTMGSDGEGEEVASPPSRYSAASAVSGRAATGRTIVAAPVARYGRTTSRCDDLLPESSAGLPVRPRSGMFKYAGPEEDYALLPEYEKDSSPSSGLPVRSRSGMFKYAGPEDFAVIGRDDCSQTGGRDDCCQGRDEQLQLSSSSDKDDSAFHEPLYYNCGSSPLSGHADERGTSGFYQDETGTSGFYQDETGTSGFYRDETGTSGFYQVQEKSLYEVIVNSTIVSTGTPINTYNLKRQCSEIFYSAFLYESVCSQFRAISFP